jgi:NAD-reducing hydrogenase small subunit
VGAGPRMTAETRAPRPRIATLWLGGCSGCHMSFLDMDERLLEIAARADLVFSPLLDVKEFPKDVDVTLVEGAVANEEHVLQIRRARERTRVLVSFGDCAVTGNVTALRNPLGTAAPVLRRAYLEGTLVPRIPDEPGIVPRLLDRVEPLHRLVHVDLYIPGCPPSAKLIFEVLDDLIAGRTVDLRGRSTFG